MTAQPATPGSDGEVCTCGHFWRLHDAATEECFVWVQTEQGRAYCVCPAFRPAAPSEPPAGTQQDDDPSQPASWRAHAAVLLSPEQVRRRDPVDAVAQHLADAYAAGLAARPSADTEKLRDALRLIAGPAPHCSASTTERHACRQPNSGRTRGARYGADAWCDQCIARGALDAR